MRIWNVKKIMFMGRDADVIPAWWDGSSFNIDHAKRMKYPSRNEAVIESKKHRMSFVEKDYIA